MTPTTARVLALHLHDAEPRSAMATVREPRIVPPGEPFVRWPVAKLAWQMAVFVIGMGGLACLLIVAGA